VTPPEGTASAIELVENAAKIANVRATVGAATLTPLKEKRHEELNITVSAEGTFAGVARFATVLESLPRASYLSNVDIEASSKGWYATYVVSFIKLK
jgi:Tfp pilus assembly protein PilO